MLNMTANDINRTYYGCHIATRNLDGSLAPKLVRESGTDNVLILEDRNGDVEAVNINHSSIVLSFPDSGVYQVTPKKAVYVSRHAQVQWRRGIRREALQIIGDSGFDWSLIDSMYNTAADATTSFKDGLELLSKSSTRSIRLSRNFWLRNVREAEYPLICFRSRTVGEVKDGDIIIQDQEIHNLFEEIV